MKEYDLIIVGGGPAGLGTAIEAAGYGVDVAVLDENIKPGGQLFKQIHKFFGSSEHLAGARGYEIGEKLLEDAQKAGVEIKLNTKVWGVFPQGMVNAESGGMPVAVKGKRVLVASGASENAISFPGCTKPGVMTAGAAQTMVNVHRVLPGRKILMIGSGNVGLIVSYQLLQAGAEVVGVIEAQPQIGGYGVHAAKIKRAGVPIHLSHTIISVEGSQRVESAVISQVDSDFHPILGTEKNLEVDCVCLAVGLTPNIDLMYLNKCEFQYETVLGGVVPFHDRNMLTTVPWIYVAGDAAGVEEASVALDEGRLAGIAIAESLGYVGKKVTVPIKEEIWRNLSSLRDGPFGYKRKIAKNNLIEKTEKR